MNKLKIMARASNYKKIVEEDPSKSHMDGFIEGFKACMTIINENIELEKEKLKGYNYMGERLFALKMYQDRLNKMIEELEGES